MEKKVCAAAQERVALTAALDGVWYESLVQGGQRWRLGSVTPGYVQMLPMTPNPDRQALDELAGRGIWLEPVHGDVPRLAVMCCGQGSVWPGMGRELYDHFPEARAAMDRLAACTNWDVLALMDETDVETIGLTRWQQPYLFLVEYAQWCLYLSRGLRPDFVCGHSLGELIALCLAGVYSPQVCWYILETRSRHMADIEAKSRRETGMMAVYAGMDVVRELQELWPDLYVSNYNTHEQSILSGPRDVLVEARRYLRKKRIAAVILNITLAFHHPSMRVLRELDYRRLMSLEMRQASLPMLSCVTTEEYPSRQSDICSSIMDLDENSVRWVECVQRLWNRDRIRHFLEMGPSDTLCSMVERIEPSALCLASAARGHEREQIRQTLARLHALGHLDLGRIVQVAGLRTAEWNRSPAAGGQEEEQREGQQGSQEQAAETLQSGEGAQSAPGLPVLRELLARASGRPVEELHASMDLRFDLALRSSFFPGLIEEAQQKLGREVAFEDLLKVSTIGDLEQLFSGKKPVQDERKVHEPMGRPVHRPFLASCRQTDQDREQENGDKVRPLAETACNPCERVFPPSPDHVVLLAGSNDSLLAQLVQTVASWGCRFVLGSDLPKTEALLRQMGAESWPLGTDILTDRADRTDLAGHLAALPRKPGLLLVQGACGQQSGLPDSLLSALKDSADGSAQDGSGPRVVFLEQEGDDSAACETGLASALAALCASAEEQGCPALGILMNAWQEEDPSVWQCDVQPSPQPGDLLARELLEGARGLVFWRTVTDDRQAGVALREQVLLDDADRSPLVFPDRHPFLPRTTPMTCLNVHYAPEIVPALKSLPAGEDGLIPVPLALHLETQRQAAILASPGLVATGLADIRLQSLGGVRTGIVRECRLAADLRPWMRHDGIMSRMCRVNTQMRGINALGRRSPHYEDLLESTVILAGTMAPIPRLWTEEAADRGQDQAGATAPDLAAWYDRQGIGKDFRMLEQVSLEEGHSLRAVLTEQAFLALDGIWTYNQTLCPQTEACFQGRKAGCLPAVEAVLQAVWLAHSYDPPAAPCARLPSLIGFIRFGTAPVQGPVSLQLRRCWDRDNVVRYDAQVVNANGDALVTVTHLEFNTLDVAARDTHVPQEPHAETGSTSQ